MASPHDPHDGADVREPLLSPGATGLQPSPRPSLMADSMEREGRGWLLDRQGRSRQASPSPSVLHLHPAPGYGEDLRALLKRTQSTATMREARARRTAWIVIDSDAKRSFMHTDKRSITHQLGLNIPIRDLRLMDFNLLTSDTGSILVRDNAIIFTIEYVRLIVTADKVLIPREGYEHNPLANRFVDILEEAIADWARQQEEERERQKRAAENSDEDDTATRLSDLILMPFELVVLEAALKEVVNASAIQVKELEGVALPALDALTKSVSTANLERVRKVKTRHQRLIIRVETLRDELQRFLHDDDDMIKMCLTRKKELEELYRKLQEDAAAAAAAAGAEHAAVVGSLASAFSVGSVARRSPLTLLMMQQQLAAGMGSSPAPAGAGGTSTPLPAGARDSASGGPMQQALQQAQAGPSDEEYEEDAEDVENLLESYFSQVDGLWDKLQSIGEYIKDTEEYINIELDSNRNRLIRLDIILTSASFAIAPFNLIAGILGENLVIPQFLTQSARGFWVLNGVALMTVCSLFYSIILYMRWRKLI